MSTQTQIVTQRKQNLDHMRSLLEKSLPAFGKVASRYLRPDRLLKVGLSNFSRNPQLLDCTPQSILLAFLQSAELGLEPGSAKKEAYLLPFRNKNLGGKLEALFLPSYTGLVTIARRSGEIIDVEARVVYDGDVFDVDYGESRLTHKPQIPGADDKEPTLVASWARALFKDGHKKFDVLWKRDIEKIRASSRAGDSGPWTQWYSEMAAKSAVRHLYKLLPKSDEMALAEDIEDGGAVERYQDIMQFTSNVIDLEAGGSTSRTAQVKADLKAKSAPAATLPASAPAPAEQADGPPDAEEAAEIARVEAEEAARERDGK